MRWLTAIAVATSVTACEGVPLPMANPAEDAAGKQFLAPPPGQSTLYIYRERAGPNVTISAGQRTLGVLGGRNWLRVDLPAGEHDVRCTVPMLNDTVEQVDLPLRSGTITYAAATVEVFHGCRLNLVAAETGRAAIAAGNRVRDLR